MDAVQRHNRRLQFLRQPDLAVIRLLKISQDLLSCLTRLRKAGRRVHFTASQKDRRPLLVGCAARGGKPPATELRHSRQFIGLLLGGFLIVLLPEFERRDMVVREVEGRRQMFLVLLASRSRGLQVLRLKLDQLLRDAG